MSRDAEIIRAMIARRPRLTEIDAADIYYNSNVPEVVSSPIVGSCADAKTLAYMALNGY
ncbi:hypothetical protein HNP92_001831 [Methanococcus maripaludis]|uniref:Uncharacterized protein n=1 Tax=Methanococcus maripaludis TaxID=39152 RepID=A0A7J9SBW0_METMI|nr:hypothetical protein [Methanococcus maripaludis]MBB6402508.1 hypothetical protein [Methanococcus maripaludis]